MLLLESTSHSQWPLSSPPPSSNPSPTFLPNRPLLHSIMLHQSQTPPESSTPTAPPSIFQLSFNQDNTCFAAATDSGFRVYGNDPFLELFRRDFSTGLGRVEMLFQCNIIAFVGYGSHTQFPPNKVMVWEDRHSRCIGELSFRTAVRSVRLRRDRIVVVMEMKVFVYNFTDFELLHQAETMPNPKGLCAVSQLAGSMVLACPGLCRGQVRVEHYAQKKTTFVLAHDSELACLALTFDGKFLATASTKGTLIRVYDTASGTLLQEVRRGANVADIYSLAFSSNAQWLAVSSDKGTVHVFSLRVNSGVLEHEKSLSSSNSYASITSSSSSLSFIKGVLPKYFKSEWSFAQFRVKEGSYYTVAFGHQKNTVIILGMDGSFYRCQFDPAHGGEMTQLEHHNFLKPEITKNSI